MHTINISRHDLQMELEHCHAMTVFLAEALTLMLEENSNYNLDKLPVHIGCAECFSSLMGRIKAISERI